MVQKEYNSIKREDVIYWIGDDKSAIFYLRSYIVIEGVRNQAFVKKNKRIQEGTQTYKKQALTKGA